MSGEDKDEIRKILSNIQSNIDFLNRKYPYLELDLETIELTGITDNNPKYRNRIVSYIPKEKII